MPDKDSIKNYDKPNYDRWNSRVWITGVLISIFFGLRSCWTAGPAGSFAADKVGFRTLGLGLLLTAIVWLVGTIYMSIMETKHNASAKAAKQLAEENKRKLEMQKEMNRLAAEREKERLRKEAEKKVQEEDRKHDLIINCPLCLGNGECMVVQHTDEHTGKERVWRYIHEKPTDWTLAGWREGSKWRERRRRETCPGCEGKGIAYAYFESGTKEACGSCQGTGKIKSEQRIKKDIGAEIQVAETPCEKCSGRGYTLEDVVHVRTLHYPDLGEYYSDNEEAWRERLLKKKYDELAVVLTEANRAFYSKTKPRF